MQMLTRQAAIPTVMAALLLLGARAHGQGDPEVIEAIIKEGTENSQVWDHLLYLSEEIGPRLTGSARLLEANAWTRDQFRAYGLENAHLRKWGEIPVRFDRGPSSARMVEPVGREFEFTTPAWGAGTTGPVRGRVFKVPDTIEELEAIESELEGAWMLSKGRARGRRTGVLATGEVPAAREEIAARLREAGVAGSIVASRDELVRTSSQRGWRELKFDDLPTDVRVTVRRSDYDAINSRLADNEAVEVEIDLQNHFVEGPIPVYNTVAEIRGTEFPNEVVIISGHLDSWDGPGSNGTQDNGTGSSVTLEAARILAAVGVKPRRTIRFCLWTGEEQGLLGARAYVESLSEEERAGVSACFVDDGGTNYQGGLVCIESMVPMLTEATRAVNERFPDMPVAMDVRARMPRGGSSDHAAFNRVGIPGFFWTEEGKGGREGKTYRFIWHTQNDTPRYAVPEYLVQSATCSAITAYNLAMADTLLPRQIDEESASPSESRETAPAANAAANVTEKPAEPAPKEEWALVDGPISGVWIGRFTGEDAPYAEPFTLSYEQHEDGRMRGMRESTMSTGPFASVTYDAESKKMVSIYESEMLGKITFSATVDGDTMEGTVAVEGRYSFPFKAERKKETEAAPAEPKKIADEGGNR